MCPSHPWESSELAASSSNLASIVNMLILISGSLSGWREQWSRGISWLTNSPMTGPVTHTHKVFFGMLCMKWTVWREWMDLIMCDNVTEWGSMTKPELQMPNLDQVKKISEFLFNPHFYPLYKRFGGRTLLFVYFAKFSPLANTKGPRTLFFPPVWPNGWRQKPTVEVFPFTLSPHKHTH